MKNNDLPDLKIIVQEGELDRARQALEALGFHRENWDNIPCEPVYLEAEDGEIYWSLDVKGRKPISVDRLEKISLKI